MRHEAHAETTAGDIHAPLLGRAGSGPVTHGEGGGGDARSTAEGLPHAPLEHAHPDAADAVVDERVFGHDELDVRSRRRRGIEDRSHGEVEVLQLLHRRQRDDHMGVAEVGVLTRSRDAQPAGAHEHVVVVDIPPAEVDLESEGAARQGLHARARADAQGLFQGRQAGVDEVLREHPRAVAAHLGHRAVGVAIVHEPFRSGGGGGGALVDRRRADDAQQAVSSDAEAAIAQDGDMVVGEIERTVGVGDHDEVVPRAVALGERDGLRHPVSLRALRPARARRRRGRHRAPALSTSARHSAGTTRPGDGRSAA